MVGYNRVDVKLPDLQLNKLKSAVKNNQGTTLKMNIRMFNGNNLPHELLLTTRQTTRLKNAIENNMSTDIKWSKAQISKNNPIWRIFKFIIKQISRSINESSCSNCKKYFSSIRNNSCCFSN